MSVGCTSAEREKVNKNITQIIHLTQKYGLNIEGINTEATIDHWCKLIERIPKEYKEDFDGKLYSKNRVVVLTKYKLAAYVAAWTNTSLPPTPFQFEGRDDKPEILVGGRFNEFTVKFIVSRDFTDECRIRKLSYLQTIIQSKAVMEKPDEEHVRYAEISTFEKLTCTKVGKSVICNGGDYEATRLQRHESHRDSVSSNEGEHALDLSRTSPVDGGMDEKISNIQFYKNKIKSAIRRVVRYSFDREYTDQHRVAYMLPSSSANYNFTRKEFGALGHLLPLVERLNIPKGERLIKFTTEEKAYSIADERIDNDEEKGYEGLEYKVDIKNLTKRVYEFRKLVFEEALIEEPKAVPFGLSEPNKVRVITKGPPATYFALKPLQKFMHTQMKNKKQFQLIGEEVKLKHIDDMFPSTRWGERMLSGDYSDATNELKSWVSDEITKNVIEKLALTSYEAELVEKSLTKHMMVLSDKSGHVEVHAEPQKEGQLMGSILSFLWLCLANLALILVAKEEGEMEEIELEQLDCLVNGDDCLFAADPQVKADWEAAGATMGLNPSIGKVFYTNEFCTLNSRMFFRTAQGSWAEVSFIQSSLLTNRKKSERLGSNENHNPFINIDNVGVRAYWLMSICPITMRREVMGEFIRNNKSLLENELLNGIDWFMPTWAGGLGLPDVADNGWIMNYPEISGNPRPRFDDSMEPEGEYKEYINMRDNDKKRFKSRCALYSMVTKWKNRRFRPIPWRAMNYPSNLEIFKRVMSRLPTKPKEILLKPNEKVPTNNIESGLFGLMAMEIYLTDPVVQNLIKGKVIEAINADTMNPYWVSSKKIKNDEGTKVKVFELETGKIKSFEPLIIENKMIEKFELESASKRKRKREVEKILQQVYEDERITTIKHNRAIWKNNVAQGCNKPASYEKLAFRKYIRYFPGTFVGKGASAIKSDVKDFNFFLERIDPSYTEDATYQLQLQNEEW